MTAKPKPTHVSQSEFARMMGVASKTATVWKQSGHLVMRGDKVDVEASMARLAERPDIYRGGKARDSSRKPEATPHAEARARLARGAVEMLSLADAQAKKENYLALLRQLEYEKQLGELWPKQMVMSAFKTICVAFRERNLAVPGKLAIFGPEVEAAARAEIHECLEQLNRPILDPLRFPSEDNAGNDSGNDDNGGNHHDEDDQAPDLA